MPGTPGSSAKTCSILATSANSQGYREAQAIGGNSFEPHHKALSPPVPASRVDLNTAARPSHRSVSQFVLESALNGRVDFTNQHSSHRTSSDLCFLTRCGAFEMNLGDIGSGVCGSGDAERSSSAVRLLPPRGGLRALGQLLIISGNTQHPSP